MSGGVGDDTVDQTGDACNWDNNDATVEEEPVAPESSKGDAVSFGDVVSTCTARAVPALVLLAAAG